MVNVPVFICLITTPICILIVTEEFISEVTALIVGIVLGIIIAWITWSVLITKWRIWAFSNVRNVHELKREAIRNKLIWKTGSRFEKTEYRSKKDLLILEQLLEKFKVDDVIKEDPKIPEETKIYQPLINALLICVFMLIIILVGGIMIYKDQNVSFYMGVVMIIIGVLGIKDSYKNILDRQPKIIINKAGIKIKTEAFKPWSEIYEEQVITEGYGSASKNYLTFSDDNYNYTKIEIDNFNTTPSKLENILRTYRIRYNKTNKI